MNSIKRKLTSQSGASITYALLLFLVCAVVSSIILAAATAASGRISQSVESDQRYYSVTSAAELLKEMINGKSVIILEQTTSVNGGDATTVYGYPKIDDYTYADNNYLTLLQEAAAYYKGLKTATDTSGKVVRDITLEVGGKESLKTKIHELLDPATGRITLTVTNDDGGEPYTLTLIFDPEVKEKHDSKTKKSRSDTGVVRTKTTTTTTTMTWTMASMG